MPGGRPGVEFTPELVDVICDRLAGGEGIAAICASEGMPARSQVYLKMARDPEFRTAIDTARIAQQESEIDGTVDMADLAEPGDWQVVKLRIWARQWRAAKMAPKRYGDRVTAEHVGKDGGPIETTTDTPAKLAQALLGMLHGAATQETSE